MNPDPDSSLELLDGAAPALSPLELLEIEDLKRIATDPRQPLDKRDVLEMIANDRSVLGEWLWTTGQQVVLVASLLV